MNEVQLNNAVAKMSQLYVLNRSSYLKQNADGYTTFKARKNKQDKYVVPPLVDGHIKNHLLKKETYGVILGSGGLTKFLTFDVDIEDNQDEAREVTRDLYQLLTNYYGLGKDEVHVSVSGSKGYHVELFFDKATPYYSLLPFYDEVLEKLGETKERIEFRPSKQGVKLPLSKNRKTGNYCHYVEPITLEPVKDSIKYLMSIEQMNYLEFKECVLDDVEVKLKEPEPTEFTLEQPDGEEFESLITQMNLEGKSLDEIEQELVDVLNAGRLTVPNTRHRISFLLPVFFNTQGVDKADAEKQTLNVLVNTFENYQGFIDKKTSKAKVISEVKRLVKITYEKGYTLSTRRRNVQISKDEILEVLSVKKWHLKKLLLSLLIHSKRYAKEDGTFYMAYSVMTRMGNDKNRTRLLQHLETLQEAGQVEIVSRGVIDLVATKANNMVTHEANRYKVNIKSNPESEKITLSANEVCLEEVIASLLPKDEAKKILPKAQFYRTELQKAYNDCI